MGKTKIALIFNLPPLYRQAVYTKIDNNWDCVWFFGDSKDGIKIFDTTVLRNSTTLSVSHKNSFWYFKDDVIRLVKGSDFTDVIAIGEPRSLSIWKLLLWKKFSRSKPRIILWSHGWYGRESRLERVVKKIFFSMADQVILYGDYAKELMIKEGFEEKKLHVIKNSLDYEKQLIIRKNLQPSPIFSDHFSNSNKNIIFIGRLTKEKRLDLLLDALSILKDKKIDLNLILVGDGSDKKSLEEKALSLGLSERVWFYGSCYDEYINAELIYNADLCVSPGNIGLTAIHAMMFGTPCITHNTYEFQGPEFEAIIEGETGTFFKRDDSASLASAIIAWFKKHPNREEIRQQCYREIDSKWNPTHQLNVLKKILYRKDESKK